MFQPAGTPLSIGNGDGVQQETLNRCFARMCSWVVLVTATVKAEFPRSEVLQSFSVFNISRFREPDYEIRQTLARLAKLVDANASRFVKQYYEMLPSAQHHMTSMKSNAFLRAWVGAWEEKPLSQQRLFPEFAISLAFTVLAMDVPQVVLSRCMQYMIGSSQSDAAACTAHPRMTR